MKTGGRMAVVPALAVSAAAVLVAAMGCSGGAGQTAQTTQTARGAHPLRGNFTPARGYDPKIDVPVTRYLGDPTQYTRHWDAETHGGTGVYEPWRDPMWTPGDDIGVL